MVWKYRYNDQVHNEEKCGVILKLELVFEEAVLIVNVDIAP